MKVEAGQSWFQGHLELHGPVLKTKPQKQCLTKKIRAQQVKMLVAKTDGHGLVLRTHLVEGEDWVPRLSSDLELYYSCVCTKTRIIN